MHVHEAAYIRQIAELGETHEVVAIEDIRSRTGVKLLARGARIANPVVSRATCGDARPGSAWRDTP
jgi:hypothetical protein